MGQMTDRELTELRRALERERNALQAAITARQLEGRSFPDEERDDAEIADRMIAQESALRMAGFDSDLLADVEHALAKLAAGTYGTSEDSGAPIPLERLRAIPWARRTLEEEERRRAYPR